MFKNLTAEVSNQLWENHIYFLLVPMREMNDKGLKKCLIHPCIPIKRLKEAGTSLWQGCLYSCNERVFFFFIDVHCRSEEGQRKIIKIKKWRGNCIIQLLQDDFKVYVWILCLVIGAYSSNRRGTGSSVADGGRGAAARRITWNTFRTSLQLLWTSWGRE